VLNRIPGDSVPQQAKHGLETVIAMNTHPLLAASEEILVQGRALVAGFSRDLFVRKVPEAYDATIGGHYRHCLDHFATLVRALDTGRLDYDARDRDPQIEAEPEAARRATDELIRALIGIPNGAIHRGFTVSCSVGTESKGQARTTFGRELMHAISHATHHYALIGVMCRIHGAPIPPGFGVAPSTVRHYRALAGSAS
jgi:uncharacterized damage-inducible protein DinB